MRTEEKGSRRGQSTAAAQTVKKSLAEFALASAKKVEIIFSGGVYVEENTARLANVRRVYPSCAAASRSLLKREPSETGLV